MNPKLRELAGYPVPIRLGAFILALAVVWLPFAAILYGAARRLNGDSPEVENALTIAVMGLLFIEFLIGVRYWARGVHGISHPLKHYGLGGSRQNAQELFGGLGLGMSLTLSLFALQGLFGWVAWQSASLPLPQLLAEGFLSALGIGFAEELVFRGWLLDELRYDYRPGQVLWGNALIFAVLHFLKPLAEILQSLPTFGSLVVLGLTLVWAKRATRDRLGLSIGLHAGLVWGYYIINVGQLIQYTDRVPSWVTGIDGNPLAGVMGFGFLIAIALAMQKWASLSLH
ncbi:type II CAAX endopeptidase family protein [Geitlerinema splendidum]|nr:type II CAAX endopeptidase family protein [Geitlerinema splendidum]